MNPEVERQVRQAIAIAVGQASMCWQHPERAGDFQPEAASFIVDELFRDLKAILVPAADGK